LGTFELAAPTIIDEHARARSRAKLRERIQVFKHPDVRLQARKLIALGCPHETAARILL